MIEYISGAFKFISPSKAQAAHICLLEAEKRQLLSLVSDQSAEINNLKLQLKDCELKYNEANAAHESLKQSHSAEPLNYPKLNNA